jgi:hypothetical protein
MSGFAAEEMSSSTLPTSSSAEPVSEKRPNVTRSKSKRQAAHNEKHNDYGDIIRDIIIGFADGLTVPFALTAGLSSLGSARLVIIGGKSVFTVVMGVRIPCIPYGKIIPLTLHRSC